MISDLRINVTTVVPIKDEDLLKLLPDGYLLTNGNDSLSKKELEEIKSISDQIPRKIHGSLFTPEELDLSLELNKKIDKIKEPFNKRQVEFQRVYLKKACGVVRSMISAIAEFFPRAGVIITYNYSEVPNDLGVDVAEVAPFRIILAHYGPSKDNKKEKVVTDDMDENENE